MSNENQEYLDSLREAMKCVTVDNLVTLLLESSKELKEKSPHINDLTLAYLQNLDNLQLLGNRINDLESQVTDYESKITDYESVINDLRISNNELEILIDELKRTVKNLRSELHGVYQDRSRLFWQLKNNSQ